MLRLDRMVVWAAILAVGFLTGCGSNGGGGGGGGGGGEANPAVVKGKVTDTGGTALAGATVKSGGASTTSAADGSYSLSLTPGAGLKVGASQAGRVATFQMITLASGQIAPVDFALPVVGKHAVLAGLRTTPATVTDPRGAEVKLAANTLVDSTGAAVDAATMDITTGMPSDAKFAASFPGLFVGTKAGADADIESFGFVTVDIKSTTGLACNLKPGATAELAIPVAAGADPGTATIDLWSLDEATGKWTFATTATRDATGGAVVYRATVTHFSTYNLDRPIASALPFTITVGYDDSTKQPGVGVSVTSSNQDGGGVWSAHGVTGADGKVSFARIPQGSVTVTALFGSLVAEGYHYDVNGGAATMTISLGARPVVQNLPLTVTAKLPGGGTVAGANVTLTATDLTGRGLWQATGVTGADGTAHFARVPLSPGTVAAKVTSGNQSGRGTAYVVANGAATLTVTLYNHVRRTITVVYVDGNHVQTPFPQFPLELTYWDGSDRTVSDYVLDQNGQVTLDLEEGHARYEFLGSGSIGNGRYGMNYYFNGIGEIPATLVLLTGT